MNQQQSGGRPAGVGGVVARLASSASIVGLLVAGTGPLAVHAGVAKPLQGFMIFGIGLLFGLAGLVTGALALLLTRGAERVHRSRAWIGAGLGLALVVFGLLPGLSARDLPRINDITTDPDDPPAFAAAAREPANEGRDMSYPSDFAAPQRSAYPDLATIVVDLAPADAFVRAQRAAGQLAWKTTFSDPESGVFEAQDISPTFLFVDDIVVRVRPEGEGRSRIDLRSKSRDGKGDLGANARRIRAFAEKVAEGK